MEDEERQKKLEAGKAKLADYRQRKAHADRQKKQKKKKRRETDDDPGGDGPGRGAAKQELDQSVGEEVTGSGGEVGGGGGRGEPDPPTTEFTFARTLRSGETVKHDQTYTIEPDSEVSTTAEDYSSEVNGCLEMTEIPMETSKEFIWDEVDPVLQEARGGRVQVMEEELAAKTLVVEELSRELEEFRAAFGTEGVQQLQDFEAALKQRDGIITQLTANLQQSRKEKDEVMREFLEMTEQSQKLHIQFQQLQAGETLRNTSHSSTAQDLLQAKQQLVQYQQQLEEMDGQVRWHQEMSEEQLLRISQLQHRLNAAEMVERTEESFAQRLNEKDLLIAEQERIMAEHECSLMQLREELSHVGREAEESFAQRGNEKDLLILEQTAIITEHERTLTMLKVELAQVGRMTEETFAQKLNEKELLIAEQERVMSEHDSSLHQLKDELTASEKRLNDLNQQMTAKAQELESCKSDLDNCKRDIESTKGELNSYRVELEGSKGELYSCRVELESTKGELEICSVELESCRGELSASRQKERKSSSEIQQLMGTVEDLQKRYHKGSLSECDTLQRMEEDSARRLDHLRMELDEMYGEQIVQMKQELRSQHSAALERVTEEHREELELLRAQQPAPRPSPEVVIELKDKIAELQQRIQEAQALREKARQELSQVAQEKLSLQGQMVDLLHDLRSAQAKVEQASQNIAVHESRQCELQCLQETIDDLKAQLATAVESAEEIEAKHESETTNYKIKLEMMEREKDAVLDRMAQSQEAELERLRTQLLFSHEEELILLREDHQRESQLNGENLLNEASIRHSRALEELRNVYEDERDELLHQIIALKDDLKMALHSSKAEELVVQLKELQVEVKELKKGGEERVRMEREIQMLLKKNELLENQSKEREKSWDNKWREQESEKRILMETNNAMKEEVESKVEKIKSFTTENEQKQRQVVELQEENEKQRNTFSFAEKNFEVNYQELKEEYTCLVEVKAQLEERILKETLVYESKLASLQSQIQELRENKETSKMEDKSKDNGGASIEKDTTELMEKLKVALTEKEELAMRLSKVTEQLTVTEGELDELEGELCQVRRENKEVIAQNENLEEELERDRETLKERKGEIELQRQREEGGRAAQSQAKLQQRGQPVQSAFPACSIKDHHLQIESLQGEVEVLRSSLKAGEIERERLRHTPEAWHQSQTPTPSAAPSQILTVGEGPVERSSAVEPTASGSYRRKTQQRRGKKKRQSSAQTKEKREKQEVVERNKAGGATAAAEREPRAQMESQVPSSSQQRTGEKDSTDGYHGDGARDSVVKQGKRVDGMECRADPVAKREEEDRDSKTTEHVECRLQLEAQRISLSQMHAAQLELLREQTDAHASTLELGRLKKTLDKDFTDLKSSKYQNVVQVVSEECKQLILSFAKIFGEEFLEYLQPTDVEDWKIHLFEKEETRDSSAVLQEAKEMYRDLQQVKQRIEQEHGRLLQLQSLLKADGNKIEAMQLAYDDLKRSSEEKITSLRRHIESSSISTHNLEDLREPTAASPSSHTAEDIQKLRANVQQQRAQLEECHRQEVERLRAYYQHQAKATEERYATELIVLQQHLDEATGTEAQFSLSSVAQLSLRIEEEDAEELKLVDEDALLVGLGTELSGPAKSMDLAAQLQTLRRALYHKYLQEVAALKEQHCAELTRLREERVQEKGEKVREEGEEDVRLQVKPDPEGINGGVRSIEAPSTEDQGGQERRHKERVEEEIAKVIVQMSVEFAQQSELARITKSARETTSAMQTHSDEEGEEEEEQTPRSSLTKGISLEEVQRRFAEEKERLEKELEERTAELHGIKEQLRRIGPGSEQMGYSSDGDGESERKESGKKRATPQMKSRGSQKEKRGEEEDEEVRRKRAVGGNVSSQDRGDDSSCPDHQVITSERNLLRKANESLRQVLSDVLKTTAAAEETIGRHVEGLLVPPSFLQRPTWQRAAGEPFKPATGAAGGISCPDASTTESCQGSETGVDDVSVWSGEIETDEGLEMSQQMMTDSLLPGAELQLENEEYLMNISSRLQAAVEKLLVAITETTNQLEHAQVTQTELMRESFRHNQEIGDLLRRQEDLQERLGEEGRAREQLALELHRAEGLIDGYTGEQAALEEQVRQKEELQLSLEQELQVTSSRLHELEQERLQMQEEREILSRQQDAMREHAGPRELRLVEAAVDAAPEADLLEETEKLMAEKVEVQRQAEKESLNLLHQVKTLEAELEEQVNRVIELEHARKTESGDLLQQIQALEKQLEKNRRFLDEQAIDREHERDVFQQEILKLEQLLKNSQKQQPGSEQRSREVDQLTQQLREKADWCSELLLASEQLQREAGERNEEIDKLEGRIRELEQALLASTETVEDKRQHVSVSEPGDSSLEAQLQTEREALDRKEKEISNLEEQLEQFREELENKSEEVQQLHMQLEIQRKELSTQQQDLETKDSLLQVMEEKDRDIALLNEQMAKLQHTETAPDNKEIDARDELLRELESQVECMRSEQQRLKRNSEEELEQLNAVIDKLQEELANIERKQSSETDEELKGQLESQVGGPSKEDYDEMKQKMDLATQELDTIKAEHCSLLERYRCLQESRLALAESEKELSDDMAMELQDALREKTAAFVVVQAQIQALEQSTTSRVKKLSLCVQELEACVAERDSELTRCRFLVERAQEDADDLQCKVQDLEDKLRERVAAVLVSQAQLGAIQQQSHQSQESKGQRTKESGHQDPSRQMEIPDFLFAGMSHAAEIQGAKHGPTGKVVLLTEKLRELEVGLSGMQKDQELQKQLLSSSEEVVLEYEKRLVLLMDLLNQMRTTKPGGCQRTFPVTETASFGGNEPAVSEILQELQKVRDEASATKEQLSSYRESSNKLQQELKAKEVAIAKFQEDLQRVSSGGSEAKVSELHRELKEVKAEAASTKEELSSYRESCDKLRELLQEREMTIAHLKGELYQASLEGDGASTSELLQELQEVRDKAAATKEHLNSFRECSEKLQTELQVRDLSIAQLQEELQQLRVALAKTAESPSPLSPLSPSQSHSLQQQQAPPSHPKNKGFKPQNQCQGAKGKMAAAAKDKPSLSRKNSVAANQKSSDKLSGQSAGLNGSQRLPHTDAGTQTDTFSSQTSGQPRSVSEEEEVEEMIGEYQEKIVQMQELHAAEILDMEARHIAESEALKRDAQILEEECKALKTVIEKLQRSHEAPSSRPERPAGSQFKDGYTSDSCSEWSQRTGYDLPNLQQEFRTTPEGARKETDEALPDRIKNLLREVHQEGMQVLSLSALPIPEGEADPASLFHHAQGWPKEREALLATVESLKALITQIQTHSRETQTPGSADWRGELLGAVQQVFVRERSVLKSALYARLDQLDTSDAIIHLNQQEHWLAEQDAHHRDAMGMLQTADRSSLLTEVRQLRAQLEQIQAQEPGRRGRSNQGVEQQRERGGVPEPHILQQADRALLEELKGELAQTKLELESTLKAQHKHLKELDTVKTEVSQKAAEVDTLADRLADEQKKARELQWAFEKEKCKSDKKEELEREELEDLKLALEEQQSHVAQLTSALGQERLSTSQLSLQAEQECSRLQTQASQLHVQLESERARAQELSSALEREKELRHHGSSWRENPEGEVAERGEDEVVGGSLSSEGLLEGLQRDLNKKHAQVVSLLDEVEAQKLAAVRREEELTSAAQKSCQDQEALREAKGQLESLGEQAREAMEQLKREVQQGKWLKQEKERLQERVVQLGETREGERSRTQQQSDNQNQAVWQGEPTDRTRDWVFQQKSGDTLTVNPSTPSLLKVTGTGGNLAPHHDPKHSDKVLGKLQLIAAKIRTMVSKGSGRLTTEVDSEGLSWLQTNIDEVITMLQQSPALPSVPESAALLAGGQSSSLTERLLRQNAELTGFVSRLTEEKNDLRNQTLCLEDELRRYRQAGLGSGDSSRRRGGVDKQQEAASVLFSSEREAWTRERSRLEKGLRLAQAEVTQLKGEIRTESLRDMTGPEADNTTLKNMYGKYLRAESFRKALIYQKKYLLLLLGGFQECEEATLSIIARMGSRPSQCSLESLTQSRRGLTRFRSAVRVSIALSRMRFLVKRWHKATGMSSITSVNVNRNGLGLSPGNEVRTDSPYLQPGSVEVYGERRGAIRGRTGRDSPRSALSSAQHRFHMAGDPGTLTCSHLQNYDPDRALTDYISRLEALQRRLGSVQSGSSSYAQLNFGIKR
ncbi:A-kinase anchor protein 9 isoform X2 [Coregonus clupeaformis]|uniref:A-kinase anchor protein 9 isoform X2 n=1 Tax=Coregonus clupeaformis TaxID=59861 RepID=UPI001E1C7921|nr:A-kinase anchor protein 9 isoform X2 [Coregonus clupeaformis]